MPANDGLHVEVMICQHPAIARDRKTNKQLFYDKERTRPVPLLKDQKGIRVKMGEGKAILYGYCAADGSWIQILYSDLPEAIIDMIKEKVAEECGDGKVVEKVSQAPRITEPDLPETDEDENRQTGLVLPESWDVEEFDEETGEVRHFTE